VESNLRHSLKYVGLGVFVEKYNYSNMY